MSAFNLPNLSGWKLRKIHEEIVGDKKPLKDFNKEITP